jgi:hypothetical protein
MARTEKLPEARAFSFRMPGQVYDVLAAVAKGRRVDVSAVLNWVLAGAMPHLLQEKADLEEGMLKAATSKVWARRSSPGEAIQVLRDLLTELQDEYAKLVKQALEESDRHAA